MSEYKGSWFVALNPSPDCKAEWYWSEYNSSYGFWGDHAAHSIVEYDKFYESTLMFADLHLLKLLDLNPSKPVIRASLMEDPPVMVVYPNAGPGFIGALFKFVGLGCDAATKNWDKAVERCDRFMSSPFTNARLVKATAAITADYRSVPFNGVSCTFDGLRIAATPSEEVRILTQ